MDYDPKTWNFGITYERRQIHPQRGLGLLDEIFDQTDSNLLGFFPAVVHGSERAYLSIGQECRDLTDIEPSGVSSIRPCYVLDNLHTASHDAANFISDMASYVSRPKPRIRKIKRGCPFDFFIALADSDHQRRLE